MIHTKAPLEMEFPCNKPSQLEQRLVDVITYS